jgi:hypothetical protein
MFCCGRFVVSVCAWDLLRQLLWVQVLFINFGWCGCDFTWLFGFNTIWGFEPQVGLGTQSEK